jgi:FBP C-terminal treble-clef zinc-finger
MHSFSDAQIRASFINASLRERNDAVLPHDLETTSWGDLDYLGWRDRKYAGTSYVVAEIDGEPVGILLRQAEGMPRSRPQCSWCEDIQLPNDVVLFSARRSGKAGRNGNAIGTLICSNFECSTNVRKRPAMAYIGFDLEAERQRRIAVLREHVRNFVLDVRDAG